MIIKKSEYFSLNETIRLSPLLSFIEMSRYEYAFHYIILLCAVFVSILSFRILHIFSHSISNEHEWLNIDIIKVLNGSQSLDSLKIINKNEVQEYAQKIETFNLFSLFAFIQTFLSTS